MSNFTKENLAQWTHRKTITEDEVKLINEWETVGRNGMLSELQEPISLVQRAKLPDERQSITHTFEIRTGKEAFKVTLTLSAFPSGKIGEVFIKTHKNGSFEHGTLDLMGKAISVALQFGVPLQSFVNAWKYANFEPNGQVLSDGGISHAASVLDYIAKYLEKRCPNGILNLQPQSKAHKNRESAKTQEVEIPLLLAVGNI
jgi:hypothetical protein